MAASGSSSMILVVAVIGIVGFMLLKNKGGGGGSSASTPTPSTGAVVSSASQFGQLPFPTIGGALSPVNIVTGGVAILDPHIEATKMSVPIVGAPETASDFGDRGALDQSICQCDDNQCCYRGGFYTSRGQRQHFTTSCAPIAFGNTVNACNQAYSTFSNASFSHYAHAMAAKRVTATNLHRARYARMNS